MAEFSNQTHCFFCRRELNDGQGRYRFFQGDDQVDCCPSCFDQTRRLYRRLPDEPEKEGTSRQEEKES
ncbi:MAG: hypothetical protein NTW95_00850 [Candidatus Aminicenantes bacterium]|nr:hypothetical protein [Candidatus Aminicenantes bacterium]